MEHNTTQSWIENGFTKQSYDLASSAMEQINKNGFPTTKLEDWKYTNVSSILKTNFKPADRIDFVKFESTKDCLKLVFINGRLSEKQSDLSKIKDLGIEVQTLAKVANTDNVKANFGKLALSESSSFVALNTAVLEEGILISVKSNLTVSQPIEIIYATKGSDVAVNPRLLLLVGDNANFTFIERFVGEGTYLNNYVAEIAIGKNSKVSHYKIQEESKDAFHISRIDSTQHEESKYENHVFNFGAKLARNEINPVLQGEKGFTLLHGLNILDKEQHVDNTTVLDHAKPHCDSREWYKGIYADKSKGVFSGTIIVRQDAQKTNAFQSNQSLLLSEDAESNAKPQLKIWADDVKCSHGATVGQLDADSLFYLRSRGVPKKTAEAILIKAFAGDILNPVELEELREELEEKVVNKLTF